MTTKPIAAMAFTIVAALLTIQCASSSSPTSPSDSSVLSGITLNASTLATGATAQGTVSLSVAAASATIVSLTSSNPAVVAVQTPITVAIGSSTASFVVTAVGTGTATITASAGGTSRQSPTITVTGARVALSSISLAASSIVGGNQVGGTVTLTAAAPLGGALVTLSAADPILVPASVTVPAGSLSATFTVSTRAVGGTIAGTITASYGGGSASATLLVTTPTVATARFGVTGETETETCSLENNGATLDCTFNGSTSSAPGKIVAWEWSFGVAKMFARTTTGPILSIPAVDCSIIPPPPMPAGMQWFTMTVTLTVRDDLGNVSAVATDPGVRLIPKSSCGF